MTLNCTSLYLPHILRLQSSGSNPVSQIFTVGFHTTASVWILRNRMLFCLVLSKGSAHFHTYTHQHRRLCCTSLWYSQYTRRQPWPDLESIQRHVNSLFKSSYYHFRALRHIRTSLPDDICLSLGTALIQSRLDYSNSVLGLYGTSVSNLHKLQMVDKTLWSELSLALLVQSPHLSSFPISTGSLSISE